MPADHYDVITSIDTLYHHWIVDDAAVVAAFHRALKPGGILVLNLVAHEFLRSSHDVAVHTRRRYTRPQVVAMLGEAGFDVELATYRLGLLFPPHRAVSAPASSTDIRQGAGGGPFRRDPPSGGVNNLLTLMAGLENRIIPRCSIPLGTSVFVVARRG